MTRVARSLASIAPAAALITNPVFGAQANPEPGVDAAQVARSLLSIPLNKGLFDVEHQAHVRAIDAERHIQFDDLYLYAPQGCTSRARVVRPGSSSTTSRRQAWISHGPDNRCATWGAGLARSGSARHVEDGRYSVRTLIRARSARHGEMRRPMALKPDSVRWAGAC